MAFTPVDDTAIHLMKTLIDDRVRAITSQEETVSISFESGAKLIIYDAEFEEDSDT